MKYELAKELKDAGFPQSQYWVDMGDAFCTDEGLPAPTLTELIEACGDNIHEIATVWGPGSPSHIIGWIVYSTSYRPDQPEWYETLEEAVARNWLKINKTI